MIPARSSALDCAGSGCRRLRAIREGLISELAKWRRFGREQEALALKAKERADHFAAEARIEARRAALAEERTREAELALADALRRS